MIFAFRVDASLEMGTGHLMRCLTLADALKLEGIQCHFVTREHPGNLNFLIAQRGHSLATLPISSADWKCSEDAPAHAEWLGVPWQVDLQETLFALKDIRPSALVVDHYAIDFRWEQGARGTVNKIVVIDDLADRIHDCDLLIDQNLGQQSEDYSNKVPRHCKTLTGPDYTLLRPEFAEARQSSLARRKLPIVKNILISMGGVDEPNATSYVLKNIYPELEKDQKVTIVLGPHSPWVYEVKEISKSLICAHEVVVGSNSMAALMRESDLAIGAAGSTAWERCCMGLPTLMAVLAENQALSAKRLQKAGAALCFDIARRSEPSPRNLLRELKSNPKKLELMVQASSKIVDGLGCRRILAELLKLRKS